MSGRFLWTYKANARLLRFEESDNSVLIEAEHDGYTRLTDPVVHRRSVSFNRNAGALSISDNFQCKERHEVESLFHLHEDTHINRIETGAVDTTWRGRHLAFASPDRDLKWDIVRGGDQPILGRRSRSLIRSSRYPRCASRAHCTAQPPSTLTFKSRTRMNISIVGLGDWARFPPRAWPAKAITSGASTSTRRRYA